MGPVQFDKAQLEAKFLIQAAHESVQKHGLVGNVSVIARSACQKLQAAIDAEPPSPAVKDDSEG